VNSLDALTSGAPASALLLAVMLLASLVALSRPALLDRLLLRPHWLLPRREWWTPVTSAFVHADLAHLLFNAFTFWAFAFSLERHIGTARFVALYALGIAASAAGTWWQHRHDPGYRTLGASGAILAVLFASIVYFPSNAIYILPIPVPIPAPLFAVAYLAYTWFASRSSGSKVRGGINHDAHLSGALTGLAFVALTDAPALARAWAIVFGD
jgi:membrane associated rhomboid family serine protease